MYDFVIGVVWEVLAFVLGLLATFLGWVLTWVQPDILPADVVSWYSSNLHGYVLQGASLANCVIDLDLVAPVAVATVGTWVVAVVGRGLWFLYHQFWGSA